MGDVKHQANEQYLQVNVSFYFWGKNERYLADSIGTTYKL